MHTSPLLSMAIALAAAVAAIAQSEYVATFSTTVEDVRVFVDADSAKLAYVNWGEAGKALHFIDFSEGNGTPVIHRIPAAITPTSPMISPDGRWVVFASAPGVDGEAGTSVTVRSSVYICALEEGATPVLIAADSAYEPRFVQYADTLSVVFPTLAPRLPWESAGVTKIAKIDTLGGTPNVISTEAFFPHAYTGGLSFDGKYLCAGFGTIAMVDVQTPGASPVVDPHPYSDQECNASITSSRQFTNRIMHLDFMSLPGVTVPEVNGGEPWGQWEVIFITDNDSNLVRSYPYPGNPAHTYSFVDTNLNPPSTKTGQEALEGVRWHDPEWSNHPYFAVATVNVQRKYRYLELGSTWYHPEHQERIALINLVSGEYHEVVRRGDCCYLDTVSRGFRWPSLWIHTPCDFVDSLDLGVADRPEAKLRMGACGLGLWRDFIVSATSLSSVQFLDLRGRMVHSVALRPGQREVNVSSIPAPPGAVLIRARAGKTTRTWKVLMH